MKKHDLSGFEIEKEGFRLKLEKAPSGQAAAVAPGMAAPAKAAPAGGETPSVAPKAIESIALKDILKRDAFDGFRRDRRSFTAGGRSLGRRRHPWRNGGCLTGRRFFQLETESFLFDLEPRKVMLLHQIDDRFNFFEVFRIQRLLLVRLRLSV